MGRPSQRPLTLHASSELIFQVTQVVLVLVMWPTYVSCLKQSLLCGECPGWAAAGSQRLMRGHGAHPFRLVFSDSHLARQQPAVVGIFTPQQWASATCQRVYLWGELAVSYLGEGKYFPFIIIIIEAVGS